MQQSVVTHELLLQMGTSFFNDVILNICWRWAGGSLLNQIYGINHCAITVESGVDVDFLDSVPSFDQTVKLFSQL